MATNPTITVGIEILEPNWPVMCMALTSHSMRALGYLEADRPDLALASLKEAQAIGDLMTMVQGYQSQSAKPEDSSLDL